MYKILVSNNLYFSQNQEYFWQEGIKKYELQLDYIFNNLFENKYLLDWNGLHSSPE